MSKSPSTMSIEPGDLPVRRIEVSRIYVIPGFNARTQIDEAGLLELRESIKTFGLLQPIVVLSANFGDEKRPDIRYALIAGERRLRAAQAEGWDHISAHVREASLEEAIGINSTENTQRAELMPYELAEKCAFLESLGKTQAEIGKLLGLSRSTVSNYLRIKRGLLPEIYEAWKQHPAAVHLAYTICGLSPTEQKKRWRAWVEGREDEAGDRSKVGKRGKSRRERDDSAPRPPSGTKREAMQAAIAEAMQAGIIAPGDPDEIASTPEAFRHFANGVLWALRWASSGQQVPPAYHARWLAFEQQLKAHREQHATEITDTRPEGEQ